MVLEQSGSYQPLMTHQKANIPFQLLIRAEQGQEGRKNQMRMGLGPGKGRAHKAQGQIKIKNYFEKKNRRGSLES